MAADHLKSRLQVRWLVTAPGAVAMVMIAMVLVWNIITAPHPLAQRTTRRLRGGGEAVNARMATAATARRRHD